MELYYFDIIFSYKDNDKGYAIFIVNNLDNKTNNLINLCVKKSNKKQNENFKYRLRTDEILNYKNISTNIYFDVKPKVPNIIENIGLDIFSKSTLKTIILKYNFISCFYSALLKYKFNKHLYNNAEIIMNNLLTKFINKKFLGNFSSDSLSLFEQDQTVSLHNLYAHGTNAYILHLMKESNNYTILPRSKNKNIISGEGIVTQENYINPLDNYVSCTYIRNFYVPLIYAFKASTLWNENDDCDATLRLKGFMFNKNNIDLFRKKCKGINSIKNTLNDMSQKEYNIYNRLSQIPIVCIGSCVNYWNKDKSFARKTGWLNNNIDDQVCEVAISHERVLNEILLNDLKIELVATNLENIKIVEKLLPSHIKVLPFELVEFFIYDITLNSYMNFF